MAFTTIPGGDLADIILLGSEAADTVVLNTSQSIIANGFGGDDSITIANPVAATGGNTSDFTAPSTIYGGEGNDSLLLGQYTVGSSAILGGAGNDFFGTAALPDRLRFDYQAAEANGNEGEDTFGTATRGIQANGSQILGGANNDTIWVGASTNTEFNGNKNLDRLNVIGNQAGGSVFGGKGIDFIDTAARAEEGFTVTYAGTSISGADGNDTIFDTGATGVVDGTTLTVLGGQGVDSINLTINAETGAALIGGGTEDDVITIGGSVLASNLTIQGGEGSDTINGFGTISGGEGVDTINLAGNARLLYELTSITSETGITSSTLDSITGATATATTFKTGVAGTAANTAGFLGSAVNGTTVADGPDEDAIPDTTTYGLTAASYTAALATANNIFLNNGGIQYVLVDNTSGTNAYIFFKDNTSQANATAAISVNDLDGGTAFAFGNIVA